MNEIIITNNKSKINLDVLYQFIAKESYWGRTENNGNGRTLETIKISIENSICFTVLKQTQTDDVNDSSIDEMIGFARVVTDKCTFSYLADVFIRADMRGKGIGKQLMSDIMKHNDLQHFRRFMLATSDAHELYRKFGFKELDENESRKLMSIKRV